MLVSIRNSSSLPLFCFSLLSTACPVPAQHRSSFFFHLVSVVGTWPCRFFFSCPSFIDVLQPRFALFRAFRSAFIANRIQSHRIIESSPDRPLLTHPPPPPTMASRYKDKDAGVLLSFNGAWVSWLHTGAAYGEFRDFDFGLPRSHLVSSLTFQPPSSVPSSSASPSTTPRSSRMSGSATRKNGSRPSRPPLAIASLSARSLCSSLP